MDCLFCKIIAGEIPSKKVYEDEYCYAFEDIAPVAPVHILFVPKEHIAGACEIDADNSALVGKVFEAIAKVAKQKGLESGWRVVTNNGVDAGQTVAHLHFHLLGGRPLGIMCDK